jgi:type II secretory pathway component PulM
MTPFLLVGAIGGVALCVVVLYFLIAAKPAFDRAAQQAG